MPDAHDLDPNTVAEPMTTESDRAEPEKELSLNSHQDLRDRVATLERIVGELRKVENKDGDSDDEATLTISRTATPFGLDLPKHKKDSTSSKADKEIPKVSKYKYTQVTISGSSTKEESRERPTHVSSVTSADTSPHHYELRFIQQKDKDDEVQIVLRNKGLKSLIWKAIGGFVEHCGYDKDWDNSNPVKIRSLHLIHHWDKLRAFTTDSTQLSETRSEDQESLKHLLDDMEMCQFEKQTNFRKLRDDRMTEFQSIHYLFTPGEYMVAFPFLGQPQLFQVDSYSYDSGKAFVVNAWAYDWDGAKLERQSYSFSIEKFELEKRINELSFYPVEFYEDGSKETGISALRKKLWPRAELFRKYCQCKKGEQMFKYSGSALVLGRSFNRDSTDLGTLSDLSPLLLLRRHSLAASPFTMRDLDDEIIIDPVCFARYGSEQAFLGDRRPRKGEKPRSCKVCNTLCRQNWIRSFPGHAPYQLSKSDLDTFKDEEDHILLLPPRVLGFSLGLKSWVQLSMDNIHEIQHNEDDSNMNINHHLILPKDVKYDNLKKMVKCHSAVVSSSNNSSMRDAISGKGDGLVLLFHGPTGVGKTLTAEMLARNAGMPLYKVGINDIGTKANEAEAGLRDLFAMAQAWNAILLIDEADVFLDSRGSMGEAELEKNAMVAVLLREIEYFSGILIMTTNRILTFDVAMLSRIHWPINFGHLSTENETRIWSIWQQKWELQNKQVMDRSGGHITSVDMETEKNRSNLWHKTMASIAGEQASGLNGREIRNIFLGARTMADGGLVKWEFIEVCYSNILKFRRDMADVRAKSEARFTAMH